MRVLGRETVRKRRIEAKVFVRSFGCASNVADGEVLAGCLAREGFKLAKSVADADLVMYNTCAVKGPTENRMIELLRRIPHGKRLIVAGCLPLINWQRVHNEVRFDGVVGPGFGEGIVDVVKRVLSGERVVCVENAFASKPCLSLPRVRLNPVVGIVPVCYGCLGVCSYCCVRFARGRLRSYKPEEVASRVRDDLKQGVREVWLTGQDLGVYGFDLCIDTSDLLETVLSIESSESFWVRLGMMAPKGLAHDDFTVAKRLSNAYSNSEKEDNENKRKNGGHMFWFLHLPVQSGDDDVLGRMRRGYRVDDFKRVVQMFRHACPKLSLATDIIVGFPGEGSEAFKNTLRLVEDVKPDVVNVSKFFARPGTEAARVLKAHPRLGVEPAEVKARSEAVSKIARRIAREKNRAWVGWQGTALIDERGKAKESWIGRNYAYKPVVVKSKQDLLGKTLRVKVVEAFDTYLLGETVEDD